MIFASRSTLTLPIVMMPPETDKLNDSSDIFVTVPGGLSLLEDSKDVLNKIIDFHTGVIPVDHYIT